MAKTFWKKNWNGFLFFFYFHVPSLTFISNIMELSAKDQTSFMAFLARSKLAVKKHQVSGLAWTLCKEREGNMFLLQEKKAVKSRAGDT